METKTVQLEIPEYLTIGQYQKLPEYKEEESSLIRYIKTVSAITGIDEEEIGYWDVDSLKKVHDAIKNLGDPKNEFHSLIEFNGVLYGYSNISQQSLGEYIDLEGLCKDTKGNLHKLAAILYRPVTEHRFDTLDFVIKQKIKMVRNKDIANVFEFYDIEKYDSTRRKAREQEFKEFPLHIILGAVSFFLANASQYLNSTVYSDKMSKEKIKSMNQTLLESLIASTGAGGGLFTHSLKPIYYQYQGINQ
jgi:hypothetical protein